MNGKYSENSGAAQQANMALNLVAEKRGIIDVEPKENLLSLSLASETFFSSQHRLSPESENPPRLEVRFPLS